MKLVLTLLFSFLTMIVAAQAKTSDANPPVKPIESKQLNITVVPLAEPSRRGQGRVNKVVVTIKKFGDANADGKVTLKAYFIGKDVFIHKLVLNSMSEVSAEAVSGLGNSYTLQSEPFVYNPEKPAAKGKVAVPASGSKPYGWLIGVYQNEKLLFKDASGQGFDAVIAAADAK